MYALRGIDLHIEKNEFTAITGASGSGKTTLLNLMGGLDKPDKGEIWIDKTEITQLTDNQLITFRLKNIGFIFQNYNLLPILSAQENVALILQLQGKSKTEVKQKSIELLEKVGLKDKIHVRPVELSGGQQQRVAIARALAGSPKFILADEPTSNLDSQTADNIIELMAQLNENEQVTFIFSTHDQRIIQKAKRIIELKDGQIINQK